MRTDMFDKLITLANKSTMQHKHAAILYRNGDIIGSGFNYQVDYMSHQYSCHAEVAAIQNCNKKDKKNLSDATLIVIRIGKDNEPRLSKPCCNCQQMIKKHGIKKIFYSV
jgi:tRNA(Arg) A34 adenosine deaminase TadA